MSQNGEEPVEAALGLGGNLGDPVATMATALRIIDGTPGCRVIAVSPTFVTPPWGDVKQPEFRNAAALVQTTLSARDLLELVLDVERRLGRVRTQRWGPRAIDIDILTYGNETVDLPDLRIPHPYLTARAFVLRPLATIAPGLVVDGRTIAQWEDDIVEPPFGRLDRQPDWWRTD